MKKTNKYIKYIPYVIIVISIVSVGYFSYVLGTMEHQCNTALREQFDRLMLEVDKFCPASILQSGVMVPGLNITLDKPGWME